MENITLDPLASLGVQGTTSMQPQMVAGGYRNRLSTYNSFLGSTSRGNHLPWNFIFLAEIMHPGTKIPNGIILHRLEEIL